MSNSFDQSESSHFKRDTSLSTMPAFGTESCFCTVYSAQLLSLHAFDTLLQKGLVFAIRRDNLKRLALIKCSMCRIFVQHFDVAHARLASGIHPFTNAYVQGYGGIRW